MYPGTGNKEVVATLYGELGKPGFNDMHEKLKSLSKQKKVTYVLRHYVKVRILCLLLSGYRYFKDAIPLCVGKIMYLLLLTRYRYLKDFVSLCEGKIL